MPETAAPTHNPVSTESPAQTPEIFYRARLAALDLSATEIQTRKSRLTTALLASIFALILVTNSAYHQHVPAWTIVLPTIAFLTLLPPTLSARRRIFHLNRLLTQYESSLARLSHQPPEHPQHGDAFRDPAHLYDRDLNLLGPDSLFAHLATTRTGLGQRALAQSLLNPPPDPIARQHAIRELTPLTSLRESITLLGPSAFQPTPPDTFDRWLAQPAAHFPTLVAPILYATSTLACLLLLAWTTHHLPPGTLVPNLAAILGLQAAVALLYRSKALPTLESTAPLPGQFQILREGLTLLQQQTFTAPALQQLQTTTATSRQALSQLELLFLLVEQRTKEWYYLPALFFNTGTHAAIRIERWKSQHAKDLSLWLTAWADFDALNALATYAFEHPANTYPEILPATHPPTFEATALTHPLLPNAIPNNVSLTSETRFYLISGSNMSGKSTLLRSIGLAVVLARAGAPIPAARARLTPLTLGASLTPTDSLAEGKSRFLAEVLRLQQILATARRAPTLFLIDELFSGTNSFDRLIAAEAVLDALLAAGAIGALSTHDLALTALATDQRRGRNVHMASPDPDDPLAFDYLLKPGINQTTNALAFLRLLNLAGKADTE
jgi:hypothetical protein